MRNLTIFISLILVLNLSATIISIPAEYPTIQQGLDAAAMNDTVSVASGVYYENIFWPGVNGIKLIGSSQEDCIIDGSSSGSVIKFDEISGIVDTTTTIAGFTIRNGAAGHGGGMYSFSASPTLRDLKVTANTANYDGGGLFCFNGSHFVIENVTISDNIADSEGGGINCDFTSCIIVNNCRIINNTANMSGGGICIEGGSTPDISYTLIANNSAEMGGGIWSGEKGACEIVNCTIANNTASVQGGGYHSYFPTFSAVNCIFWSNTPDQIYEDGYITYSDVQGGWAGMGNIDSDPLFVDITNGDYHLTINSPCIDAGDPAFSYDPDGTISDMGCYYFDQQTGIDEFQFPVQDFGLLNYPNPFNPITTIRFDIKKIEKGTLSIFNIKGQLIKSQQFDSGKHNYLWDASNHASGVYFYKLISSDYEQSRKMLLLK